MFIQSYLVIIILVILIIAFSILGFFVILIKKIYKTAKRKKNIQEIYKIADLIYSLQQENIQDLYSRIKMPKKMKLSKENDELFIHYEQLTYNVNKGRYIE